MLRFFFHNVKLGKKYCSNVVVAAASSKWQYSVQKLQCCLSIWHLCLNQLIASRQICQKLANDETINYAVYCIPYASTKYRFAQYLSFSFTRAYQAWLPYNSLIWCLCFPASARAYSRLPLPAPSPLPDSGMWHVWNEMSCLGSPRLSQVSGTAG